MMDKPERILVVDDDEHVREVVTRGLMRSDYDCVTAGNADEAAKVLGGGGIDLVVLDITMPGKSGLEFLPEIVRDHPDVAVVMLTAHADTSTAVWAMREGSYDFAAKPVNLAELTIRIVNALFRRKLVLENRAYQKKMEGIAKAALRRSRGG